MWFACANMIAFSELFETIFHGKTSAKGWKKSQGNAPHSGLAKSIY